MSTVAFSSSTGTLRSWALTMAAGHKEGLGGEAQGAQQCAIAVKDSFLAGKHAHSLQHSKTAPLQTLL